MTATPAGKGGGEGEVCSQLGWEEQRGRLHGSHPPPTVASVSFPLSPASSVAAPSPGGGELPENESRTHFWPKLPLALSWVSCLRGSPVFLHGGCLSVCLLQSQPRRLFLALVLPLIRSRTLDQSVACPSRSSVSALVERAPKSSLT